MISLEKINDTILEIERHNDTTFSAISKLADLYIVKDHMKAYESQEEKKLALMNENEVAQACNGKPEESVWTIFYDLMDSLKVLHPKVYHNVLKQLRAL